MEGAKEEMRAKSGIETLAAPQLFNGDTYLGVSGSPSSLNLLMSLQSYEQLEQAVEDEQLMQFLQLA